MKFYKKSILVFLGIILFACGNDDDAITTPSSSSTPGATNTEFVINATDAYVTPNAYLLLNDAAGGHERDFTFVFSDGTIIEDTTNEIAIETTTNNLIKVTADLINTVATEPELPIFIWPTQSLPLNIVLEGEHFAHTDIQSFNSITPLGPTNYGQVDTSTYYYSTGINIFTDPTTGQTFTINAMTWDLTTRTGTIDCSFVINDDANNDITGVYVGNFKILTGY